MAGLYTKMLIPGKNDNKTKKDDKAPSNPYVDSSVAKSFISEDDSKDYIASHSNPYHDLTDVDDKKCGDGVEQLHFKITSDADLRLDYQIKSKALRDESGFNVIPMDIYDTPKPVISFTLGLSYDQWNREMEDDFLAKLAKELMVNKHELVILCKSRGSVNISVLINAVTTQFNNIRITCAYIQNKAKSLANSSTLKKFCIKSTQIKEWFTKKLKDNTANIKKAVGSLSKSLSGLNKGEQWILNQSKVLKSKIDDAITHLNGQYIVSAMCILDNDAALQKFIQHPNLHQSKLLFHGTYLNVLGSIYEDGLKHGGGAVYGHGSYLTASPLHSINYMICYKSGKSNTDEYTLIAAYVNCGRIRQIYDMSYCGKNIESPYDSHCIASVASVADTKYLGYPKEYIKQRHKVSYTGNTANEYAIKDKTRILPRFYITLKKVKKDRLALFVWRDRNVQNAFNSNICDSDESDVHLTTTTSQAIGIINQFKDDRVVYVITNGRHNAEEFVSTIRNDIRLTTEIIVFTASEKLVKTWAFKYDNITIMNGASNLREWVRKIRAKHKPFGKMSNSGYIDSK